MRFLVWIPRLLRNLSGHSVCHEIQGVQSVEQLRLVLERERNRAERAGSEFAMIALHSRRSIRVNFCLGVRFLTSYISCGFFHCRDNSIQIFDRRAFDESGGNTDILHSHFIRGGFSCFDEAVHKCNSLLGEHT